MPNTSQLEANRTANQHNANGASFLSDLSSEAVRDLNAASFTSTYPKGAVIFMERQTPRGVFVLREGEMKLSISSSEGKTLTLRIAKAGEVLGLMAVLSGKPYEVTAEALRPCQVAFVRRDDFLRLLARHPEMNQAVVRQMGAQYQTACEQIRTLGLSTSVTERLARLLLEWSASPNVRSGSRITLPLTHEQIAEFIGTTRESVTRAFSDFKSRQVIVLHGSTLTIPNRADLESCIAA
jgi:CRP/FNR family transcriptional regulator, cyclic AMP receptor protein